MTAEQFLRFADPLPEPMLLLLGDGVILAGNRALFRRVGWPPDELPGRSFADTVTDLPQKVSDYMRNCCRSRAMVLGSLTLRAGEGTIDCRAEGALVEPKTADSPAAIILRLIPKESVTGQFVALNQRIDALGLEINRRQRAEVAARESTESLHSVNKALAERLSELETANAEIRNSRRAALNLMEDAMQARKSEERHKRVLELVAYNAPLTEVFNGVLSMIKEQSTTNVMGAILLLDQDGVHLRHGAAPHLPEAYSRAIDGITIGPNVGSCGTAAFLKKPVYVSDIAKDPRWADYAELALSHNLRACWSTPIFSSSGQLFGTFAMYYPEAREPEESDLRLVEVAARVAALAIEGRRSEAALRESNERFRNLADHIPQLAWIPDVGTEGQVHWFNRGWFEYTGTTLEEMAGSGWKKVHHPDFVERVAAKFEHYVKEGLDWEDTFPLRGKDGQYRWFLSRMKVFRNEAGEVLQIFGTSTDITVQRDAAETLAKAKEQTEAASRAKDDFLAALSHELRTPLTPVLMTAAALEGDSALPSEIRDQLAMMRRNIQLEARLIDDLLDLTRVSSGKLTIAPEPVDIHQLLQHTAEIVRSDELVKQVNIVFLCEAERHHAEADPTRIQQVFWNLIKNALKFTPAGGSITVRSENDADEQIVVRIIDTGIGISPEALPHIFNAFDQGDVAGQHRYGGLGLGLAISQAIVAAHDGVLRAESEGEGRGATFTVALDTVDAPPSTAQCGAERSAPGRALRLLIVEDHEATRTVLARLLQGIGHRVVAVGTIREALDSFAREHFDAVISDLGLPDGSGIELMSQLRTHGPIPGIALSGYGMEEDVRKTRGAGFIAHLVKPVNLDQLRQLLQQLP